MRLFTLLLALFLLAGCSAPADSTDATKASVQALHIPGHALETETCGIMQVFPTQETAFSRIYPMGSELLLQSGGNLTRLSGASLQPQGQGQAQVVLRSDTDGIWVFRDGSVVILDSDFAELQTISLPEDLCGTPGISGDGLRIYYLQKNQLKVLDCSTGLSSLLRDNMTFSDGSVKVLSNDLLLLQLTQEDGTGNSLLVSALDGSTQYPDYAPQDAAQSDAGLQLVLPESAGPLVLLLTQGGTAGQLTLQQGEDVLCFWNNYAITTTPSDTGTTIRLYSFSSRLLLSQVELPGIDGLGNGCFTEDGILYITARDGDSGLWWVLRWNFDAFPPESQESCLTPYYTRQSPDRAGMAQCREKADALAEQYGVSILLFDEAAQAAPWDYAFTAAYRVDETQWALENLDTALSAFPDGFLQKLCGDWDGLTVCIVSAIQGTAESGSLDAAEGLQFQSGTSCFIALAPSTPESLHYTLFHEFSHLIDTQVLNKSSAYDNWNDLNPQDFAYAMDYTVDTVTYAALLDGDNRAFIDAYAMTYPSEDRARIFECACNPGNQDLFTAPIMQQKLLRICTGIRQAFGLTKDPTKYIWEQYLDTNG